MLTSEQVDQLYVFCRKHSVEFYDVQVELVDHLANAIEDKMAVQPMLSFDAALKQVYKSFGARGFAPLVQEKEKAARKYNHKIMRRLFLEQLRWPKVFVALSVFALTYLVLKSHDKWMIRSLVITGVVSMTVAMMAYVIRLRHLQKETGRKFLLVNIAGISNLVFLPINCFNMLNPWLNHSPNWVESLGTVGTLVFCTVFTAYVVLGIVCCQAVWHIRGVIQKSYPHLFKVG